MTDPIWNCPLEIPELRRSQLRELGNTDLLDRYHKLQNQLADTMDEMTSRWLAKETSTPPAMCDAPDFQEFFEHYLACAFWAETTDEEGGYVPLDSRYSPRDLAPADRDRLEHEARDFFNAHQETLRTVIDTFRVSWGQHGHDFWLTRNGHGAGFWDRGYGVLGRHLTDACRPYGGRLLVVGDDGKVHVG